MQMMRSKTSKDSSRSFQVSSEISFLISVRKTLLISDQTIDVTFKSKFSLTKHPLNNPCTPTGPLTATQDQTGKDSLHLSPIIHSSGAILQPPHGKITEMPPRWRVTEMLSTRH